jgi:hypothetical protein
MFIMKNLARHSRNRNSEYRAPSTQRAHWRPWREEYPNPRRAGLRNFARAGRNFAERDADECRSSIVRANAVKSAQLIHRSAVSRINYD